MTAFSFSRPLLLAVVYFATLTCCDGLALFKEQSHANATWHWPLSWHAKKGGLQSWVTLLSGNSVNITQQVDVQLRSVSKFSKLPHFTLVTPDVPLHARWKLKDIGSNVIRMDFAPGRPLSNAWWVAALASLPKENADGQVAFLEPDAYLTKDNADGIFTDCQAELCGVKSVTGDLHNGVLLANGASQNVRSLVSSISVDPSLATQIHQRHMVADNKKEEVHVTVGEYAGVATTQLQFQALPEAYNPCDLGYGYADAAAIVHPCGDMKLDNLPLCAWSADKTQMPSYCGLAMVTEFQRMLQESNECSMDGQHVSRCDANPSCHWCGEMVRCRPSQQECALQTPKTIQLAERLWHADPDSHGWIKSIIEASNSASTVSSATIHPLLGSPVAHPPGDHAQLTLDVEKLTVDVEQKPKESSLVSIIVPACNRNAYVKMTIEQIAAQSYPYKETIVVDDGELAISEYMGDVLIPMPEEGTNAYSFMGMTVRLIRLSEPLSIGMKRNKGIEASRGDIIVHWDEDDLYEPNRVHMQIQTLLSGQYQMNALELKVFGIPEETRFIKHPYRGSYFLGSLAYSKTLWLRLGGFQDTSNGEDLDFVERSLTSCHQLELVSTIESVYTRHWSAHASNTWTWTDATRKQMVGENPDILGIPAWLTPALLRQWRAAEVDADSRGSCKVHQQSFAPSYVNPQHRFPAFFPLMAPVCCVEQTWRCNSLLALARDPRETTRLKAAAQNPVDSLATVSADESVQSMARSSADASTASNADASTAISSDASTAFSADASTAFSADASTAFSADVSTAFSADVARAFSASPGVLAVSNPQFLSLPAKWRSGLMRQTVDSSLPKAIAEQQRSVPYMEVYEGIWDQPTSQPLRRLELSRQFEGSLPENGMVFKKVASSGQQSVDLTVALVKQEGRTYLYQDGMNGVAPNGWARVNVLAGTSVELDFLVQDSATHAPADVGGFALTFCGLDISHDTKVRKSLVVDGVNAYRLTLDTEVEVSRSVGGSMQFHATQLNHDNAAITTGDNDMTLDEMARCVSVEFPAGLNRFQATLSTTGAATHSASNFFFAGSSMLDKVGKRYPFKAIGAARAGQ